MSASLPASTPEAFDVTLALVGQASVQSGVVLELVARNHDSVPRSYCRYYTPFEGFLNDILEVVDEDGKKLPFNGPLASRPAPSAKHYVTLGPGESSIVRFDLLSHYRLSARTYRVRTGGGIGTLPRSPELTIKVGAEPVDVRLNELAVELAPQPGASSAGGVFAILTVTNRGIRPQRFCKYHTPFEGTRNSFLEIVGANGKRLEYGGMMAKRAAPTDADYLTLAPGQAMTQRFDLREGYTLAPGTCRVRFLGGGANQLPDSDAATITVGP